MIPHALYSIAATPKIPAIAAPAPSTAAVGCEPTPPVDLLEVAAPAAFVAVPEALVDMLEDMLDALEPTAPAAEETAPWALVIAAEAPLGRFVAEATALLISLWPAAMRELIEALAAGSLMDAIAAEREFKTAVPELTTPEREASAAVSVATAEAAEAAAEIWMRIVSMDARVRKEVERGGNGGPTPGTSLGSSVWAEIKGARRSSEMALSCEECIMLDNVSTVVGRNWRSGR